MKQQVKRGLLLDVVDVQGVAILQLLSSEDEALLVRWDACDGSAKAKLNQTRNITSTSSGELVNPNRDRRHRTRGAIST
jgi:hypothetical protein